MRTLSDCLQNRRWQWRASPFPHVVARNVFTEPIYREQAAAFRAILDRGLADSTDPDRFSRSVAGYDVFAYNFHRRLSGSLDIFLSREWHDTIANAVGVTATGDVKGGFHHHAVGSASGRVHNDLNPGWFSGQSDPNEINLSNHGLCNYHNGATHLPDTTPRETVRAAALIFYLNNPDWKSGDGGETGLYSGNRDPVEAPAVTIPPIDNSLMLFECTPHSYHAFIANMRRERNSLIMWVHRRKDEVVRRWGERAIVKWSRA